MLRFLINNYDILNIKIETVHLIQLGLQLKAQNKLTKRRLKLEMIKNELKDDYEK